MPVTVVPTSFATVAIETFITELSSVMRNWPAASVSSTSIAPLSRADGAAAAVVIGSSADRPDGPARRCQGARSLRQRLPPDRLEPGLRDRPAVEELLAPVGLRGRSAVAAGSVAQVGVELGLLGLRALDVALRHPVVLRDQVREDAEERQEDGEEQPAGLPPAGEVV